MIRNVLVTCVVVSTPTLVLSQSATPTFEVASIKAAAPQTEGRMWVKMGSDAGRIDYVNTNLRPVIARAYGVKNYQITGPSWLDSERFDILAKIPDGVATDKVPAMLQALLAERFKMVVRRETKEHPVYALLVGKNGPKLTKAAEGELGPNPFGKDGPPPPPPGASSGGAISGATVRAGSPGSATGGGRGDGAGPGRGMAVMMGPGGLQMRKVTMGRFVDMLSNFLDRPIVDMTEIQGEYDINLEVSPEEMRGMRMMRGGPMMATHPTGAAPAGGGPAPAQGPAPEGGSGGSIFSAIQQLGLKLDPRKAPIEQIIIEKMEKVPTEN